MHTDIQALESYLSNNQLSSYYAKQLTASMDTQVSEELSTILRQQVERYSAISRVSRVVETTTDFQAHLQIVLDLFPSAFFVISNELYRDVAHYKSAKLLQIAGIASILTKDPSESDYIDLFIDDLNPEDSLEELNQKVTGDGDGNYIPKIVYDDFVLIRKHYKNLVVTKNAHDLIDIIFSFRGLLQIYLKYYFDLIVNSRSDGSSIHINKIFSILFASLKYQEAKYWNFYSDSRQLQTQLFSVIQIDSPSNRHPVLRKHIFDSLKQYNPIIKDARTQFTTPEVKRVQMNQLEALLALSVPRLAALLETVFLTKGRSNLVFLLTQVLKSANQKLFDLKQYAALDSVSLNKDFVQIIDYFVDKLSSTQKRSNTTSSKNAEMGTIIQTAESMRRLKAKKQLKEKENKGALTYDQVSAFIEQKMNKMYQRVKKGDVLTNANISGYLAKFADTARALLAIKPGESKAQAITNLQVSTDAIITDIVKEGHLTPAQAEQFKVQTIQKSRQLANAQGPQQAELIEQIGVTLADASIKSDRSRRAKKEDRPRQVAIVLKQGQISDFLEDNLERLYVKAKQNGALSQDKTETFLALFSQAANKIMADIPIEKKDSELNKFIVSTEHIFNDIVKKGFISEEKVAAHQAKNKVIYARLKSASQQERASLVEEIGIELANISFESNQRKARGFPPVPVEGTVRTQYHKTKMLTQYEVPKFLEDYLKKLYAKAKQDGALTQDQVSTYLQQFANTAKQVILYLPPEKRPAAINNFKISTDDILSQMTEGSHLSKNELVEIRLEIHGKIKDLNTDSEAERIEVVDQIGLILADTYEKVEKTPGKPGIDKEFLKREIIPYGLDATAKLVSANNFFSFPFGDRKGPPSNNRYNYHLKYLDIALKEHKIKEADYEKIVSSTDVLPEINYKKYFNIFPNDQFEETTFMAVFDLWQNKALESLVK